jgi:glycosyltransferase involved in cell wall biosynthesis
MTRHLVDLDRAPTPRPRVADIVPRLQLRGAEIFAQHLEVALRDRFVPRLLTLYADGTGQRAWTGDEPPVDVAAGVPGGAGRVWRSRSSLRARIAAFEPDVIVAHGGDPLRHAVLAGAHRRAPLVYIRVAAVTPDLRTPARWRSLRYAYGRVDAFVAVSGSLSEELVEVFGVPPWKIRVIRNGRIAPPPLDDARRERIRAELGAAAGQTLVLWAGRFVREKDPVAAVRLAGRLPAGVHTAIVGAGPLEDEVRAAAASMPGVTLAGERVDAPTLIGAGDLLVSTSRTEGAPGVFVEALLAGVPVVAHDMGGVRDVISRETGALVPPGDEAGLAREVTALAADPGRRARAAAAARQAGARFRIEPVADAYAEVYLELLSARAPHAPG